MKSSILVASLTGLFATQPVQRPLTTSAFANEWLDAAAAHEPGATDAPLQKIASWNADRLERVLRGIRAAKPSETLNQLLERGAVLHGDITLLNQALTEPTRVAGWTSPGHALLSRDGEALGESGMDAHAQYARAFLRAMRAPTTVVINGEAVVGLKRVRAWEAARANNPRIRQWFRALSAHFAARRWLSDQLPHLDEAARVVGGDTALMFDAGCYGEVIASPEIQRSLSRGPRSAPANPQASRNPTALLLNERLNLADAERRYRTALEREPRHAEARVRLAHVLSRRDRPADAVATLQSPLETSDRVVRYYGALVLAQASEATGHLDAATKAYEGAAALFPLAQSPILALLRLARARGDEQTAKDLTARVAGLGPDESRRHDPWWVYYDCNGRNRDIEVERLWALYRREDRR